MRAQDVRAGSIHCFYKFSRTCVQITISNSILISGNEPNEPYADSTGPGTPSFESPNFQCLPAKGEQILLETVRYIINNMADGLSKVTNQVRTKFPEFRHNCAQFSLYSTH